VVERHGPADLLGPRLAFRGGSRQPDQRFRASADLPLVHVADRIRYGCLERKVELTRLAKRIGTVTSGQAQLLEERA